MPKSKRSKIVSLTKTKKKGLESKHKFIEEIRQCIKKYDNLFLFSYHNMRNKKMKEIRLQWRDNSRFFFCKNTIMAIALGRTSAEEVSENIHLISQKLAGNRGLFFTSESKKAVLKYFDNFHAPEFARAGNIATETIELEEGPLEQFPHNMEPQLRKLGLPTELRRGIPALRSSHVVCKKDDVLTAEQAKILELLDIKMANFKLVMEFLWSKDGSFEDFGRSTVVKKTKTKKLEKVESEKEEVTVEEVKEKSEDEEMDSDNEN